jgi:outer membrane protein OmpA-like peptidoglycan-associated protein
VKVNEDDGSYAAVVRMTGKEDIVLKVEGEDIAFNAKLIAKKDEPITSKVLKVDVETPIVEANKPILLNDIYYAVSSSKINEESLWILEQFAEYLQEHPGWLIEIRGHTDNVGDEKANESLSLQRANEVMKYLSSKGVPQNQMTAKGYGESKPVATNDTEAGRAKNRRTEFVIKKL